MSKGTFSTTTQERYLEDFIDQLWYRQRFVDRFSDADRDCTQSSRC